MILWMCLKCLMVFRNLSQDFQQGNRQPSDGTERTGQRLQTVKGRSDQTRLWTGQQHILKGPHKKEIHNYMCRRANADQPREPCSSEGWIVTSSPQQSIKQPCKLVVPNKDQGLPGGQVIREVPRGHCPKGKQRQEKQDVSSCCYAKSSFNKSSKSLWSTESLCFASNLRTLRDAALCATYSKTSQKYTGSAVSIFFTHL